MQNPPKHLHLLPRPDAPPEAEASLLGAILINGEAFAAARAAGLCEGDFLDPAHRKLWHAFADLDAAAKPFDPALLLERLEHAPEFNGRLMSFLAELTARVHTSANAAHYAAAVREASARRRLARDAAALARLSCEADASMDALHAASHGLAGAFDGTAAVLPLPWDVGRWLEEAPPEPAHIFRGLVPRGGISGIVGQGGSGKGWLTEIAIVSACIGRRLLEVFQPTLRARVLWLESEDPEEEIWLRLRKIAAGYQLTDEEAAALRANVRVLGGAAFPLAQLQHGLVTPTRHYHALAAEIVRFKPDLIVIDPLAHFCGLDENANTEMSAFLGLLRDLAAKSGVTAALWLNHHVAKGVEESAKSASARGASAIRDAMRSVFALTPLDAATVKECRLQHPELYVRFAHVKANWSARLPGDVVFKRDCGGGLGGLLRQINLDQLRNECAQDDKERLARALAECIGDNPGRLTVRDICKQPKGKALRDALKEALGEGQVSCERIRKAFTYAVHAGYLAIETLPSAHGSSAEYPRNAIAATSAFRS